MRFATQNWTLSREPYILCFESAPLKPAAGLCGNLLSDPAADDSAPFYPAGQPVPERDFNVGGYGSFNANAELAAEQLDLNTRANAELASERLDITTRPEDRVATNAACETAGD